MTETTVATVKEKSAKKIRLRFKVKEKSVKFK